MPESPGSSLLQGLDTGSTLMRRIMQSRVEQAQQNKNNALLPLIIQHYQDQHKTAADKEQMQSLHNSLINGALRDDNRPLTSSNPRAPSKTISPFVGNQLNMTPISQGQGNISPDISNIAYTGSSSIQPQVPAPMDNAMVSGQGLAGNEEHELRPGNPSLAKLDRVGGLVPGIPKPETHMANGMVFTTYPSGRMTVQQIPGGGGQTPGEKNISAKEASKIRDQATALVNSANLVNQGYGILDNNPDLTGPGNIMSAIPIPFSGGSKINLSNNAELGKFNTVTGKLQAELGRYVASRGGVQAVKWAASVKPSAFNPEDYNYGMFEGIQQNLQDDYKALNDQYKAATGKNLPIVLPSMQSPRVKKGVQSGKETGTGKGKVIKWKMVGGQLVKE